MGIFAWLYWHKAACSTIFIFIYLFFLSVFIADKQPVDIFQPSKEMAVLCINRKLASIGIIISSANSPAFHCCHFTSRVDLNVFWGSKQERQPPELQTDLKNDDDDFEWPLESDSKTVLTCMVALRAQCKASYENQCTGTNMIQTSSF